MSTRHFILLLAVITLAAGMASAMSTPLPDTSKTVTFTANVPDQCTITSLPSTVSFSVGDLAATTNSSPNTVSISGIIVGSGNKFQISLAPNSAKFGKPTGASVTWNSSDVSWDDGTSWLGITGGKGNAASMSDAVGSYTVVATSNANPGVLATSSLVFKLGQNTGIDCSGQYQLNATWKLESL